jgi:hypothetical protein
MAIKDRGSLDTSMKGGGLTVSDVFSTYVYEGTGAALDIVNDIDLATEGGMVWIKDREFGFGHAIYDTERGATKELATSDTNAELDNIDGLTSLNSDGFTVGNDGNVNLNGNDFASWTFRKAPKFFDVVKYTGNGVAGREIPHELGCDVGMLVIKRLNEATNWSVWHRGAFNGDNRGYLNNSDAFLSFPNNLSHFPEQPSSTVFTVSNNNDVNNLNDEYIAYLFAHNETDGLVAGDGNPVIKCGSFTGTYPTSTSVTLGFEPQYIMLKSATSTTNWYMFDNIRGIVTGGNEPYLAANSSSAEGPGEYVTATPTGFEAIGPVAGETIIYMAIARDTTTVPTSSDEVFSINQFGTESDKPYVKTGFVTDMAFYKSTTAGQPARLGSRLTQGKSLEPQSTASEFTEANFAFDYNNGYWDIAGSTDFYSWAFKRATSFFDVVTYTGDGVAGRTVNHNLGVVPSVMWIKCRSNAYTWAVIPNTQNPINYLNLDSTSSLGTDGQGILNSTSPTENLITLGASAWCNFNTYTYVAYLFGDLAGVSSSFTFTADGTKNIDLGFTTGVKWVWLKRTDSTGDFIMVDVVRGLDNYLALNTTAAQTSGSGISQHSNGFTSSINDGGTYVGWAIANEI